MLLGFVDRLNCMVTIRTTNCIMIGAEHRLPSPIVLFYFRFFTCDVHGATRCMSLVSGLWVVTGVIYGERIYSRILYHSIHCDS